MKTCDNCALRTIQNGICPIFNRNMEGERGCPYFTKEIQKCENCGTIVPKGGFWENNHFLCAECATGSPCKICKYLNSCALTQDQTCGEPLYISVQQRQGNMIVQTQKLNPRRIQLTCAKNCPSFRKEGLEDGTFCWKQLDCGCERKSSNL